MGVLRLLSKATSPPNPLSEKREGERPSPPAPLRTRRGEKDGAWQVMPLAVSVERTSPPAPLHGSLILGAAVHVERGKTARAPPRPSPLSSLRTALLNTDVMERGFGGEVVVSAKRRIH